MTATITHRVWHAKASGKALVSVELGDGNRRRIGLFPGWSGFTGLKVTLNVQQTHVYTTMDTYMHECKVHLVIHSKLPVGLDPG